MSELHFSVKSGLKDIIGKDLIVDDNIAIFELVKNSYDASATNVTITFRENAIIIADNGKGMSLDDIKNKWLAVAYSAKKDGTEDNETHCDKVGKRKFYAGAKGIGRFSCDRLGNQLEMLTHKEGSNAVKLNVNWQDFSNNAKDNFVDVAITYEELFFHIEQFPDKCNHGTILKILGIQGWDRDKKLKLKHSLEKLINPFKETDDFRIKIVSPIDRKHDDSESNKRYCVNGLIKNQILDVLKIKSTKLTLVLKGDSIETTLEDRGTLMYKTIEPNNYVQYIDNLVIELFFLNRAAKYNFSLNMGVQPQNYGSVMLFRNGFRVYPYGEVGSDAWGIDKRKQQGFKRFLGSRELFGRVDLITEDMEDFKDVSSRDGGLVETSGVKMLKELFSLAHLRLERYVAGVLWGEGFNRNNYFLSEKEVVSQKQNLREDVNAENIDIISNNIGSKLDFIRLIKGLIGEKGVEIVTYNTELIDIIEDGLEQINPQVIRDLAELGNNTQDPNMLELADKVKQHIDKILREKAEAEEEAQRAIEESRKAQEAVAKARRMAEIANQKAKEERERRQIAEKARIEAQNEKLRADAEREKKERERLVAELNLIKEKRAKEEEERKRKLAEERQKEAEERRKEAEEKTKLEQEKNQYLTKNRNTSEEVADLIHTIKISSTDLIEDIRNLISLHDGSSNINEIINRSYFHATKINKLSTILTDINIADFKAMKAIIIDKYIKEYLSTYISGIKFSFINKLPQSSKLRVSLLDLSIILDNIINNARKAGTTEMIIVFSKEMDRYVIDFSDNGKGVSSSMVINDKLFELGITDSVGGTGVGLSSIRQKMRTEYKGDIQFIGNNINELKGATFRLVF